MNYLGLYNTTAGFGGWSKLQLKLIDYTLEVTREAIKRRNESMKITDSFLYRILRWSWMIWVQS